jgi:WD40 repeat protein
MHAEILRQRDLIERSRLETLYAATINLIGQAWEVGEMERMRRLLAELVPAEGQTDLRGFEWHYLRKLAHSERAILSGHADVVRSVAFSRDGKWCVSGSGSNDNRRPGELLRWDIATGKSKSLFQQKAETPVGAFLGIRALAVSPDDALIAVSDNDRVRILDSVTGEERHALPVQRDYIGALAFSPAGDLLVVGTLDGSVAFWNPESGEEVASLAKQRTGITSLAFSADGDRLAIATGDTRAPNFAQETTSDLAVWNIATRLLIWQSPNPGPLISCVAFSPNGKLLATADLHRVQTWDAADGKFLHSSPEQGDKPHAFLGVAFSPDGSRIASCGDSSIIRVWDVPKCRMIGTLKGHEAGRVTCLAFSPDGLLATGGDDRSVRLWNPSETPERTQLGPHSWAVQATVFSGDSKTLAVADYTSVALYDPRTAKRRQSISLDHWYFGMDLSPDGRFVATGGNRGSGGGGSGIVKLWDTVSGKAIATLDPHTKSVRHVNFSADGRHLLATGWGREANESHVTVWNVEDHAEIATWKDCPFAAFSPDSRTVALMHDDGIAIWDLSDRRERFRLSGPVKAMTEKPPAHAMQFSSDGKWLAAVRSNSSVEIWQLATQTRQATLSAHANVRRLSFSPDSKTLATMSTTELRLWNCDSFEERCTIPVGECAFVFTPDSATLITSHGGPTFCQVASGRSLLKLPGYGLPVNCLSISPDGTLLTEAGGYRDENEGAFLWRAPAAE